MGLMPVADAQCSSDILETQIQPYSFESYTQVSIRFALLAAYSQPIHIPLKSIVIQFSCAKAAQAPTLDGYVALLSRHITSEEFRFHPIHNHQHSIPRYNASAFPRHLQGERRSTYC